MAAFDPQTYGPVIGRLLRPSRLNELGPGTPNEAMRGQLAALTAEGLLAPQAVCDCDMAAACLAAVWLYHDFLDESHRISQEIESAEGSYWHGILHRREPDYSNAKYWFRRVGCHTVGEPLAAAASELAGQFPADEPARFLAIQSHWDHFRFVDLCQAVAAGRSTSEELCRRIQQREWELLFDYCYGRACALPPLG